MTNIESAPSVEQFNPLNSFRNYEALGDYGNALGVMAGGMGKGPNELEAYARLRGLTSESIESKTRFLESGGNHEAAHNLAQVQERLKVNKDN